MVVGVRDAKRVRRIWPLLVQVEPEESRFRVPSLSRNQMLTLLAVLGLFCLALLSAIVPRGEDDVSE
jgi:hypothetical protein